MKKNNKGKEILKLLQENYEVETGQDLSAALQDKRMRNYAFILDGRI